MLGISYIFYTEKWGMEYLKYKSSAFKVDKTMKNEKVLVLEVHRNL